MPGRIPGRSTKGVFRRSGKGVLGQGVIPPQDLVDSEDAGAYEISIIYNVYDTSQPPPGILQGTRSATGFTTNEGLALIMDLMFNKEECNVEYFREIRSAWNPDKTWTYSNVSSSFTPTILNTSLQSESGTNPYTRVEANVTPGIGTGGPRTIYGICNVQDEGSQWRLVHYFNFASPLAISIPVWRAFITVTSVLTI